MNDFSEYPTLYALEPEAATEICSTSSAAVAGSTVAFKSLFGDALLELSVDGLYVQAIVFQYVSDLSECTERIALPQLLRAQIDSIPAWLGDLERGLCEVTKNSIFALCGTQPGVVELASASQRPPSCACVAYLQVMFTAAVDGILDRCDSGIWNDLASLELHRRQELQHLTNGLRGDLQSLSNEDIFTTKLFITTYYDQMLRLRRLRRLQEAGKDPLIARETWRNSIRFILHESGCVVIECGNTCVQHSGIPWYTQAMVRTADTHDLFAQYLESLRGGHNFALVGAMGTGKIETVHDFCNEIGMRCLIMQTAGNMDATRWQWVAQAPGTLVLVCSWESTTGAARAALLDPVTTGAIAQNPTGLFGVAFDVPTDQQELLVRLVQRCVYGQDWSEQVSAYLDAHCSEFFGDDSTEMKMEWTELHNEFCSRVDTLLDAFSEELGIPEEELARALLESEKVLSGSIGDVASSTRHVLQQIEAALDYLAFHRLMMARQRQLEREIDPAEVPHPVAADPNTLLTEAQEFGVMIVLSLSRMKVPVYEVKYASSACCVHEACGMDLNRFLTISGPWVAEHIICSWTSTDSDDAV